MSFIIYALGAVGLASAGQICLKLGLPDSAALNDGAAIFGNVAMQLLKSPLLWAGLASYAGSTLLWMMALSTTQLNRLYPFTALTFAVVMLLSRIILRESMTLGSLAGCALVLLGLYFVVRG